MCVAKPLMPAALKVTHLEEARSIRSLNHGAAQPPKSQVGLPVEPLVA